jgi:methylated-DNA-[protein]-cysteine S-methyltransferase
MFYAIFDTAAGWVGILGSARGLRRATLSQRAEQAVYDLFGDSLKNATASPQRFSNLIERYRAYFSGCRTDFPDALDLAFATPFQHAVWQVARDIPYGQTRSYQWVADRTGNPKALRAVGQALARNPLPIIIPCHRVLSQDGGLGGFSGGLKIKRFLLRLETKTTVSGLI